MNVTTAIGAAAIVLAAAAATAAALVALARFVSRRSRTVTGAGGVAEAGQSTDTIRAMSPQAAATQDMAGMAMVPRNAAVPMRDRAFDKPRH